MSQQSGFLHKAMSRSFYYGASSILGKIIGFLMLPVYTSYLTPEDYGVASFLMLYVSLCQILLGGKLESTITKFFYDENNNYDLASIILTCTIITFVFCILPISIGLVYSDAISFLLFDTHDYGLEVAVITLAILFGTLELYTMQYIRIVDLYKTYLAINLFVLVAQVTLNVVLIVVYEVGVLGLLISNVAALVLKFVISGGIMLFKEKTPRYERALVKPLIVFSAPLWLTGLAGLYVGSIDQVFINYFASLKDLGLFGVATTFAGLIVTFCFGPFWTHWQVERFKIYKENNNPETAYRNIYWGLLVLGLLAAVFITAYAPVVLEIMTHESFHDAYFAILPLTIATLYTYLSWFVGFSFLVTSKTSELAVNSFVFALIVTACLAGFVPLWGFVGAAYAACAANVVNLVIVVARARKYFDMQIPLFRTMAFTAVCSCLMLGFGELLALSSSLVQYFLLTTLILLGLCVVLILLFRQLAPDLYRSAQKNIVALLPERFRLAT